VIENAVSLILTARDTRPSEIGLLIDHLPKLISSVLLIIGQTY